MQENQPTQQPDKMDTLAELLRQTPRAELEKMMAVFFPPEPKKKRSTPHASRAIQRKVITVHYHCRNCEHTHIYTTELAKGQSRSYIRKDGTVGVVMVKADFTPLTIQSWTNSCEMCKVRIATWSREKLEERYLQLLCRFAFHETPSSTNDWYKAMSEDKEEE